MGPKSNYLSMDEFSIIMFKFTNSDLYWWISIELNHVIRMTMPVRQVIAIRVEMV